MSNEINIEELERSASAVKDWRCDCSWMDTSEDNAAAFVGDIDEDGNTYPVITIDCEQYLSGTPGDSGKMAGFYARANPSAVLALIDRVNKAEAECDALAAKLKDAEHDRDEFRRVMNGFAEKMAEMEGQPPIAYANGDELDNMLDDRVCVVLGSEDGLHRTPVFRRPVPVEPVNVDFGMRGENMFFKIGNQSFLLDYKPEEQDEFDCMKAMLLSAFSRITHGVKTESQPVNARILDVSTGKLEHINAGLCPDSINGPDSRDPACPACRAIAEADADLKLACALQGTHGAGRETEWVKEQIRRQAESDVLSDLLGSLREVCETFSSTNRLWKDTAVHAMAQRSIARAEAAPKAVRLTHSDIAKALASAGLKPEDYREDGEILPLVVAIEAAALRKNGIEVAE